MVTRRSFFLTLFAGAAMPWQGAIARASAAELNAARRFMDRLAKQAIEVLRRSEDDAEQREAAFRVLLSEGFDVPFIGRFVLGRHWRNATPEQRDRYLALFSEFLIKTYTRRLSEYSGEVFRITGAHPAGKKDVIVRTRIERPSGDPIKAGWRIRGVGSRLKIIDVSIEGVSMAVTQRAEFASVVQHKGIDGLLQALSRQTEVHLAKTS